MLTQWFTPEPTLRGVDFARALVHRGHDVRVITGFPNYPGGELYPNYRVRAFQREQIDGISVIRLPLYPSHDGSAVGRALNYLSFAIAATVAAPLVGKDADVAYVYHPPGTVGLSALVLRLVRGIPFMLDVQDLWPDTLTATGMLNDRRLLGLVGRWMSLLYRYAGRISVLSPGMKSRLIGRGVAADKIDVTLNWAPDPPSRATQPNTSWREVFEGRFNIVFAGTIGKAQALDAVLRAAALVGEDDPGVQFVFIGDGVEKPKLRQTADAMGLNNTVFLPRVSFAEVDEVLEAADVLLVHLRDDPLFAITIPSKTQAYLASGTPILMAMRGDAADLVDRAQAGVLCDPEQPLEVAACVKALRKLPSLERAEMGRRGRQFYEQHLSRDVAVDRIEASLCAAATSRGKGRWEPGWPRTWASRLLAAMPRRRVPRGEV